MTTNLQSQFPPISVPFVDPNTGAISTPWYRCILGLFLRTGGAVGVNNTDIQTIATEALATAQTAEAEANLANTRAIAAQSTANSAINLANTAQTAANSANSSIGSVFAACLQRQNNLSDLNNITIAQTNLQVQSFPITITFDTCPASLARYIPIVRNLNIPANFAGTLTWCGVVPFADAVLTVQRIRGGVTFTLGTITLIHSGNFVTYSTQPIVNLLVGDVLVLRCPTVPDSTLANLGVTFLTTLA